MNPAVVFADPEAVLVDYLTQAWAGRDEVFAPGRVSTGFPAEPLEGDDTVIQVELESSNADDYPVAERARVRIVCHAASVQRSSVKALASVTQTLLDRHPGSSAVAGVFVGSGRSGVATDPDTGNLMVWFLVRVNLMASPLAP